MARPASPSEGTFSRSKTGRRRLVTGGPDQWRRAKRLHGILLAMAAEQGSTKTVYVSALDLTRRYNVAFGEHFTPHCCRGAVRWLRDAHVIDVLVPAGRGCYPTRYEIREREFRFPDPSEEQPARRTHAPRTNLDEEDRPPGYEDLWPLIAERVDSGVSLRAVARNTPWTAAYVSLVELGRCLRVSPEFVATYEAALRKTQADHHP